MGLRRSAREQRPRLRGGAAVGRTGAVRAAYERLAERGRDMVRLPGTSRVKAELSEQGLQEEFAKKAARVAETLKLSKMYFQKADV